MTSKLTAACVLILSPEDPNMILGVARKDNFDVFGLPGGKVEEYETTEEAAVRETKEETGLDLENLELIFSHVDDNGNVCVTYLAQIIPGSVLKPRPGEAPVKWVTRDTLKNGPFGGYNTALFKTFDGLNK